jgi:hypothetical protein
VRAPLVIVGLAILLAFGPFAIAQTTPDFNSGIVPYAEYHGGDIDSIDLAHGNVNLRIPLMSFPQRGSALRLNFVLNYNSAVIKRPRIGFAAQAYWQWSTVDTNPFSVSVLDDQTNGLYFATSCSNSVRAFSHASSAKVFA